MKRPKIKNLVAENTHDDPTAWLRSLQTPQQQAANNLKQVLRTKHIVSSREADVELEVDEQVSNCVLRKNPRLPFSATNRLEATGFIIIGESGAGKTRSLEYLLQNHPAFRGYGVKDSGCQLIRISAPVPLTLRTFGMAVLRAMYPTKREFSESEAWPLAFEQLRKRMMLFLVIEDLQHVLHQKNNDAEIQKIVDVLKKIMNSQEWPVYLIMTATKEIYPFLELDFQLKRRLKYVPFNPIDAVTDFEYLTSSMAKYGLDAKVSVAITRDRTVLARLCHTANYQMGYVFEILIDALLLCVQDKRRKLTIDDFADAYSNCTTEPFALNPFLADDWQSINTLWIHKRKPEIPEDPEPVKKKKKRTRQRTVGDE
jgi:Bacterial TniB protein